MAIKRFTRPRVKNQTKKDNTNRDPPRPFMHLGKVVIAIIIFLLIYAGVIFWLLKKY